jgi:hypothetical protein
MFNSYVLHILARPFASSLASLSACDMNTIHPMADPHIRVELTTYGFYCGPIGCSPKKGASGKGSSRKSAPKKGGTKKRKPEGDRRDYFDEYCNSVFPSWPTCKQLAMTLVHAADDELIAAMNAYRDAPSEHGLYDPFEYLANRAFELARRDLVEALKPRSRQNNAVSNTEANVMLDALPNLVAAPTYSRPILGSAGDRK